MPTSSLGKPKLADEFRFRRVSSPQSPHMYAPAQPYPPAFPQRVWGLGDVASVARWRVSPTEDGATLTCRATNPRNPEYSRTAHARLIVHRKYTRHTEGIIFNVNKVVYKEVIPDFLKEISRRLTTPTPSPPPLADAPLVRLSMGRGLTPGAVKEGQDVYFTCDVIANPNATKVAFYHEVGVLHGVG